MTDHIYFFYISIPLLMPYFDFLQTGPDIHIL